MTKHVQYHLIYIFKTLSTCNSIDGETSLVRVRHKEISPR